MSAEVFRDRLLARLAPASISLTSDQIERLAEYWRLLERWNSRINLTSLPLRDYPSGSVDRLIVEPLLASPLMPATPVNWYDLGSGGGSPAIPLKIVTPGAQLIMVESRSRKAAFLREVVRSLALTKSARVEARRFEDVAAEREGARGLHHIPGGARRRSLCGRADPARLARCSGHPVRVSREHERNSWLQADQFHRSAGHLISGSADCSTWNKGLTRPGQRRILLQQFKIRVKIGRSPHKWAASSLSPTRREASVKRRPQSTWRPRWRSPISASCSSTSIRRATSPAASARRGSPGRAGPSIARSRRRNRPGTPRPSSSARRSTTCR